MSEDFNAPDVGGSEAAPVTLASDTPQALSVTEAARALAAARHKPKEQPATPAQAQPAAVEQPNELVDETNTDPVEPAPGEETSQADPVETQPPIEPPRSWTKEAKDRWNALPREAQDEIVRIETSREREFRRSQNEAAEKLKAVSAKEQAAEQVRQQYEAQLPALMQALTDAHAGQFSDIKTMDDVVRMAAEDPFRKIQWDTHQQKLQAVAAEVQRAEQRKAQEAQSARQAYAAKEAAKFAEFVPEYNDPGKRAELETRAINFLTEELEFSREELAAWANTDEGHKILNDHRWQRLIFNNLKFAEVQKAKAVAIAKPVPPVQRPGVAKSGTAGTSQRIQDLENQLPKLSGLAAIRAAADLTKLRRGAASR